MTNRHRMLIVKTADGYVILVQRRLWRLWRTIRTSEPYLSIYDVSVSLAEWEQQVNDLLGVPRESRQVRRANARRLRQAVAR